MRTSQLAGFVAALFMAVVAPAGHAHEEEQVSVVFESTIPNIPGKSLIALVVNYPPGAKSPSHRHAKSAFIFAYVVSGAIESQVNDEPKRVYRAGESWYENPGWAPHVLVTGINRPINAAAHDVDGDGIPEIALAHEFANVYTNV